MNLKITVTALCYLSFPLLCDASNDVVGLLSPPAQEPDTSNDDLATEKPVFISFSAPWGYRHHTSPEEGERVIRGFPSRLSYRRVPISLQTGNNKERDYDSLHSAISENLQERECTPFNLEKCEKNKKKRKKIESYFTMPFLDLQTKIDVGQQTVQKTHDEFQKVLETMQENYIDLMARRT